VVVDGPLEPTDSRTNLPAARVVLYGRAAEIEQLAGEVLSLPIYPELADDDVDYVCQTLRTYGA